MVRAVERRRSGPASGRTARVTRPRARVLGRRAGRDERRVRRPDAVRLRVQPVRGGRLDRRPAGADRAWLKAARADLNLELDGLGALRGRRGRGRRGRVWPSTGPTVRDARGPRRARAPGSIPTMSSGWPWPSRWPIRRWASASRRRSPDRPRRPASSSRPCPTGCATIAEAVLRDPAGLRRPARSESSRPGCRASRRSSRGSAAMIQRDVELRAADRARLGPAELIEATTGGIRWLVRAGHSPGDPRPVATSAGPTTTSSAATAGGSSAIRSRDAALDASTRRTAARRRPAPPGPRRRHPPADPPAPLAPRPVPDRDRPAAGALQADDQAPPGPAPGGRPGHPDRGGRAVLLQPAPTGDRLGRRISSPTYLGQARPIARRAGGPKPNRPGRRREATS